MNDPKPEQPTEPEQQQQHTGNHPKPGEADKGGADRFGGTRTGAENVEPGKT
ncbi:MAG: hypothetical protein JOZ42_14320 [Acetobacteraceae bacterium]|nr:hypothetical protein [Acetobacteraceae bacterium]